MAVMNRELAFIPCLIAEREEKGVRVMVKFT